ncbi:hypothetical protein ILUMI_02179 [Ignelater luminosus]|uniref:Uncharacterized protein n=1 Tax=Ignelater luminosus TaxID=2038154 RepID=A0A8K0DIT4_IGNLU|nr:hypothetical protein ILUMI_02179 [Ignelater luminosus]
MAEFLKEYILEDETNSIARASDDISSSETVTAKAVAMACLFTASFIMGILPIKLSKWFDWETDKKNKEIVSLLLCFGGGVLMCTTFLHLLPEVTENVQQLVEKGIFPDTKLHFSELLMCAGFFVMYLIEESVHVYLHRRQAKNEMNALRRSLSIRRGETSSDNESTEASSNSSANLVKCDEEQGKDAKINSHNPHLHNHTGHSHIIVEEDSVVKTMRGLLVVLALSIHELFEGLAVGLESSSSTVWYMFGAVAAHKFVIAFCIGVELVSTKTKTLLTVIYVFTFSIVSALGIGIGIAVSVDQQDSTALVSTILQGLATGTLLYVVFFEILQKDQTGGLKRYFAIFVGFSIMFGLTVFTGHDHSHGGEERHDHR